MAEFSGITSELTVLYHDLIMDGAKTCSGSKGRPAWRNNLNRSNARPTTP